jgi:rubrerythrin
MAAGSLAEQMVQATREFPPSSPGGAAAAAEARIAYAQDGESLGEVPPPAAFVDRAKSAIKAVAGGQPTLVMDKLGERLAFERAGARLYEALLSKHRAFGSFDGGPSVDDLLEILHEEYQHADILEKAITALGGDPTAVTPSANLAANISVGLPQVLADPRANLLQSLEAILVAELADNECWTTLEILARQAGQDELAEEFAEATGHEREHLTKVRSWIAAGQRRDVGDGVTFEAVEAAEGGTAEAGDEEFTFSPESAVDREGYVVSEEEQAAERPSDAGTAKQRPPRKSGRQRKR